MNKKERMDSETTDFLRFAESLVDEEIQSNTSTLLVHHVNGNENSKLVVGVSKKGKSRIAEPLDDRAALELSGMDKWFFRLHPFYRLILLLVLVPILIWLGWNAGELAMTRIIDIAVDQRS
ncbi:MAG: hypothetical protein V3U87_16875 [Methylococcaceae bacterium]